MSCTAGAGRVGGLLMAAALGLGCHKADAPTDGGPTILPPDTEDSAGDPVDSGLGGEFIDATYFVVVARFGFDPLTQTAVSFAQPGEGLSPPELDVLLLDTDAITLGITDKTSCAVTLTASGSLPIAGWAATHGAWVGFDWPASATVKDHCQNYGLPGSFSGDAAAKVTQFTWGVGVGPLDDLVRQSLASSLPAAQWAALEPYAVGAAASSTFFSTAYGGDGYSAQGYALADKVDGNFEIVVGGTGNPQPIQEALVHEAPTVTRAYYEVTLGPFLGANLTLAPVSRP